MSQTALGQIIGKRLNGTEPFVRDGTPTGPTLLDFWRWSASHIVSNAMRGLLAEYIVACELGDAAGVRTEWDSYDVRTADGLKVEVKSSAYIQSWAQKRFSNITFGIRPTQAWEAATNDYTSERTRQADIYVFCLLSHKDQQTLDPMKLEQWQFWVVPTVSLDEQLGGQKTLSLSTLQRHWGGSCGIGELAGRVAEAGQFNAPAPLSAGPTNMVGGP
jgi:hypothetical protein